MTSNYANNAAEQRVSGIYLASDGDKLIATSEFIDRFIRFMLC